MFSWYYNHSEELLEQCLGSQKYDWVALPHFVSPKVFNALQMNYMQRRVAFSRILFKLGILLGLLRQMMYFFLSMLFLLSLQAWKGLV